MLPGVFVAAAVRPAAGAIIGGYALAGFAPRVCECALAAAGPADAGCILRWKDFMRKKLIAQFMNFGVVGVAFVIDYGLLVVLTEAFGV